MVKFMIISHLKHCVKKVKHTIGVYVDKVNVNLTVMGHTITFSLKFH
jgi:hypothetical protein